MEANVRQRHKPAPLTVQVMLAERQLLDRRRLVGDHAALLARNLHRQLTSPTMLFVAGGLGFAAGLFSKRKATTQDNKKRRPRSTNTIYSRALKLIAVARTLSRFFPASPTDSSVHSGMPDEAPTAQYRSVAGI